MPRNIDELSNLKTKSEPPEQYFKKMDLDEEQVERRIEYTEKANELFDVILILLLTMQENGPVDYGYARGLLENWLLSLIAEFTTPDDYLIDYATDTAYNFIDASERHEGDPWYTSADRSLYNAENSANDVLNYDEYQRAIEAGKTHKKWITENDKKVRDSHRELHNKVIPIKEYFRVGIARMRFPKDYEYASMFPEELVNCRCSIKYLPETVKSDTINKEKMKSGEYPVTNEQIEDILNNELAEFQMPVIPVYNPRLKSQGLTRGKEQPWGTVTITSIQIGKQVKNTRECLIDTLLHEYLEAQIMLNKNSDPFYADLYKSGDAAIHSYIDDFIESFFKAKGLDYGLV